MDDDHTLTSFNIVHQCTLYSAPLVPLSCVLCNGRAGVYVCLLDGVCGVFSIAPFTSNGVPRTQYADPVCPTAGKGWECGRLKQRDPRIFLDPS